MDTVRHNLAFALAVEAMFLLGAAFVDGAASLQTESRFLEHNAALTGERDVISRISHDFSDFAGSDANARSLVAGLRSGTAITLTAPYGTKPQPSTVSFMPPTPPMGNGNVIIGLALARQQLASFGITQPTPQQIKAALVGGTVSIPDPSARTVTLTGVLTQRSRGVGWGNIAKSQGVTLESVLNGMKSANHDLSSYAVFSSERDAVGRRHSATAKSQTNQDTAPWPIDGVV